MHLEVVLEPVLGIVYVVDLCRAVVNPVFTQSTKIKLLGCTRAKSLLEVVLEPVVGIVFGVNLYGTVMNPVLTSLEWL